MQPAPASLDIVWISHGMGSCYNDSWPGHLLIQIDHYQLEQVVIDNDYIFLLPLTLLAHLTSYSLTSSLQHCLTSIHSQGTLFLTLNDA